MVREHLDAGGCAVVATHQPLSLPRFVHRDALSRLTMATTVAAASTAAATKPPPARGRRSAWALARDLRIALRSKAELGIELLFYVIVVTLFPLATSPAKSVLATMAPGVLWVAALLASLLSLPRLFAADHADGTLEQIALSPWPLPALVSGKIAAHWLTTGLPGRVARSLLSAQYALEGDAAWTLAAAS